MYNLKLIKYPKNSVVQQQYNNSIVQTVVVIS